MKPYNPKQAFAVYCTFAGIFMIIILWLCFAGCKAEHISSQTNSKYTYTK